MNRKPATHTGTVETKSVSGKQILRTVSLYGTDKMWCASPYERWRKDSGEEFGTRSHGPWRRRSRLLVDTIAPISKG